ncbi:diacylglycerol/lipid kinase family protein [Anaeromyxobacter oryzisoli]|uniref:diacylglycerol/lipid kinase family protein n=1 Tax=Anaeromyxobacter oryzisoli TaxID=2925408 RepID=UPI001F57FFBA|nr:diacylglycerol kinase family protein [Anaeromyxobacter sp. SG63]
MKPYLIVNPASAAGRTGRHFDAIARAVHASVGAFECAFTKARGDGVRLAREARDAGAELIVAVGGDGTASEVIDGLVGGAPRAGGPLFGFIPRGTGGDLRRALGLAGDVASAARTLARGSEAVLDLGRITFAGPDGARQVRHFANVAGFGVSGVVSAAVNRGLKLPSGRLSFMLASARALLTWSDRPVRWRADEGPWQEERLTALSVCNGRYFGGGMQVAPDARMDDGLFDVVVWKGLDLVDFVGKRRMLYDGTHVELPNTRVLRARTVEAEPLEGAEIPLDVDGEAPGVLPARFEILPGALRIRVGP